MRPSRADEVAARVVAWHNRHPLALRITSAHVQGVGVVSLPMFGIASGEPEAAQPAAQPGFDGATLRERARGRALTEVPSGASAASATSAAPTATSDSAVMSAAAERDGWQAAFSEDFLPPLKTQRIADFASRQGTIESSPADGLRREVPVDDSLRRSSELAVVRLVLQTAAIEAGSRRVRVLLGGDAAALLGGRLWSLPRALVASLVPFVLAAALFGVVHRGSETTGDPLAATPVSAPASGAAAVLGRPVAAASTASDTTAVPSAAPAMPASAVAMAPGQPRPVGRLIDIRPRLSVEAARDAKRAATALRAGQPLPRLKSVASTMRRSSSAPVPAPTAMAPMPPPAMAQASAAGRVYAVVARSMHTRMAAGVMLGLMQGVAQPSKGQRTEVLPSGGGWRATWWPFENADDARRAQEVLARAGVAADIVEF